MYVASYPRKVHRLIIIINGDNKTLIYRCFPVVQQCFIELKVAKN